MRKELCSSCGKEALVKNIDYRFDEIGIPVLLTDIDVISCPHCGNIDPIIPDLNGLMHVIAFATISQSCKMSGHEIRFLRKYLGMNGRKFSELLHIDPTTLSKWENGEDEIGPQSDRLIRLLASTISNDLRPKSEALVEAIWEMTDRNPDPKRELQVDPQTLQYTYA